MAKQKLEACQGVKTSQSGSFNERLRKIKFFLKITTKKIHSSIKKENRRDENAIFPILFSRPKITLHEISFNFISILYAFQRENLCYLR